MLEVFYVEKPFKVRVCGCRTFDNYELLEIKLNYYLKNKLPNVVIVSGGGKGADYMGEMYAKKHNLPLEVHRPNWDVDGRSAGPKNNEQIVKNVDAAIAFWDGKSKGTKHTIDFCKQYKKKCIIVEI